MKYLFDTHVHIYPRYDLEKFFRAAFWNLREGVPVLFLTERWDCHFFRNWKGQGTIGEFRYRYCEATDSVEVQGTEKILHLIPGRQVVARERIEILALGRDLEIPDGQSARDILAQCHSAGVKAVLPWSFGKWSGERGAVVRELIADRTLSFALGDPGHRGLPEPELFRFGREQGRKLLCGSDPLPLGGEEKRVGSYAMCSELSELKDPRSLLDCEAEPFGKRVGLVHSVALTAQMLAPWGKG